MSRVARWIACAALASAGLSGQARGQAPMEQRAAGTFEVELTVEQDEDEGSTRLGRMRLDKRYTGGLQATAVGSMLTAMSPVEGSAAYTAIERVYGMLEGRSGSFVLVHLGTLERGAGELDIRIVADSGTGELEGIRGRMLIEVDGGLHRYVLDFSFPDIAE
ncbi:MAG: DUF3224 domain-containing protein [Xanthomonadales bacterium]|nr:DUF3224 domain-containing protein [Xanthomonadales bacterium]